MAVLGKAELRPGMKLAEDVFDRHGRLLLGTGLVLEDHHIRSLKLWGIPSVNVQEEAKDGPETSQRTTGGLPPEILIQAKAEIAELFQINAAQIGHPIFRPLVAHCMNELAQELAGRRPKRNESLLMENEVGPQKVAGTQSSIPPALSELIEGAKSVASLPAVYNQIVEVVNDPRSSAADVAHVISGDTGLTARLLKLVNSAMYGFPGKIDTVSRAITLVGMNELCELALATSVIGAFGPNLGKILNMAMFWQHSLCVAAVAKALAGLLRLPNSERLFTTGLLHDIGRLVLFAQVPELETRTLTKAARERQSLSSTEGDLFGYTHAGVGRALLTAWNLPDSHWEPVGYHHRPSSAKRYVTEAALVHVADIIACALRIGSSGEQFVPALEPAAWSTLGIAPDLLPAILEDARVQVAALVGVFDLEHRQ